MLNQFNFNKTFLLIYFIITGVFLLSVVLSFFNYSFYGYYSDKILAWIWVIGTIILFLISNKNIKRKFIYSFIGGIILTFLGPFYAVPAIIYFTTIGDYQQVQLTTKYRLELSNQMPMGMTRVVIFERRGIFEKIIFRPLISDIVAQSLKINKFDLGDEFRFTESAKILEAKYIKGNAQSMFIKYKILEKKAKIDTQFMDGSYKMLDNEVVYTTIYTHNTGNSDL